MSIDVMMMPSCSSSSPSALLDQFSPQLAPASSSSSSASASPPPGRSSRSNAAGNKKFEQQQQQQEFRFVQNAVAMALLARLHRWCCQLFWLTIVCLIGYCGDSAAMEKMMARNCGGPDMSQSQRDSRAAARTFQEVRKSIVQASQRRGCKTSTLQELEMQLLRHLTCPQTAVLRPLRPSQHKKRHFLSRPPSPQLFDISEETE